VSTFVGMALVAPAVAPRRRFLVCAVLVALAIAAVPVAARFLTHGAQPVSVHDALQRFRASHGAHKPRATTSGPTSGVYLYRAVGQERLSLLGTQQRWGNVVPAIVAREDARCWSWTVDFNTHHSQSFRYCARGAATVETGGTTKQAFAFPGITVTDTYRFTCSTAPVMRRTGARAGAMTPLRCRGVSLERGAHVTATGTTTFVGRERVRVGPAHVDADHVRSVRELAGSQRGVEQTDVWVARANGLPLRMTRTLRVHSPAPVGSVTYTEAGSITLASLTPLR
jgi:hypothetical protein